MPDSTVLLIALPTLAMLIGIVLGWFLRGGRSVREKAAINDGWKEQLEARRSEQRRLVEQNRGLAGQLAQAQAAEKDATNRARELASALKETFQRRDELQGRIKDIRSNLQAAVAERRRLESDVVSLTQQDNSLSGTLKAKDEEILRLRRELDDWQDRLPPLIRRFRDRDDDAKRLESALDRANERIMELESGRTAGETHVESTQHDSSSATLDASNDARGDPSGRFPTPAAWGPGNGGGDAEGSGLHATRDDLQAIRGVGPAIEKTLNDLGICRFSQIADMSEYDINRVAEHLKGFRTRVYREDWIGQARELQYRRGRRPH
jgi:predicted flap endonuclease-1-like 5' DNA nuclease